MTDLFTIEEGSHTLRDGTKLYTKTWIPTVIPKAFVVFVHGFSDHINRFSDFFPLLVNHGIQVHGFDQRGWGRSVVSKSDRGRTGPTTKVIEDITSVLEDVFLIKNKSHPEAPLFLMGHSMGGAEVLYWAARGPENVRHKVRGFIATAPYIALHPASQPSRVLVISGRIALKILPNYQMEQRLEPDRLSRDPAIGKSYDDDELCHNIGTLEGLGGMIDRGEELEKGKVVVEEGSVLVVHGTGDLVTHYETTKRVFDEMPMSDKTMKSYDGWYHVLHGEPGQDKITYANDIIDWISARLETKSSTADIDSRSKL